MPASKPNRNITRIDINLDGKAGTHGYEVRFMRRNQKIEKFFGDKAYGGKRKALKSAREYRDQLERDYPSYSRQEIAQLKSKRNSSGIVGVQLVEEVDKRWPSQPSYLYWVAQWSPAPYVRKTKRFSVNKHGFEEARRLAIEARENGLKDMED